VNTDHVSAFYWTAVLQSATAAGKRLGVSQPTITTRIQKLEKELSARLFERDPLRLTAAGERALPALTRVWQAEQEAKAALVSDARRPVRFRLGVIESVLHSTLGELVVDLRAHESDLQLEMTVHTSLELEKLLEQGALDLAVAASPASGKQVHTSVSAALEMVFVGNRKLHPRPRYALDQLAALGLVSFQPKSQPFRLLTRSLEARTRTAAMHTASSISAMVALVKAGFGVATLPRVVVERLSDPTLCILQCDQALAPLPIHISYRTDPGEPRHAELVRRVLGFMRQPAAAKRRRQSPLAPL
jgi:DNA-binding transcriptional LysR family regulator